MRFHYEEKGGYFVKQPRSGDEGGALRGPFR